MNSSNDPNVAIGKMVRGRLYVHATRTAAIHPAAAAAVSRALSIAGARGTVDSNVFRIDEDKDEVGLLNYPTLGDEPFPALASSWRVHLKSELATFRDYDRSLNPPILHRTELILPAGHASRELCAALTRICEDLGLFENAYLIGFRRQWLDLIASKGYELRGFELVPVANVVDSAQTSGTDDATDNDQAILRYRTALSRVTLSAPVQALLRDRLLSTDKGFFDYGCGRGDDIAGLRRSAIQATGWDPHYCPSEEKRVADVVNLGFVVNVIEDKLERIEALEAAFGLAKEVLSVSAMLATTNQGLVGRCYRDGVITGRSTFQKYYTQGELQQFIEQVLDHDAYPAAPGVFYVFKDRAVEQSYLISKSANRSRVARARLGTIVPLPTPRRAKSAPIVPIESDEALQYIQLLWNTVLELGRLPLNEEVPTPATAQRCFGSVKRAIGLCLARNDPTVLQRAREGRIDDILVMIALQFFGKRRKFNEFSARLQRDVKEFFGSLRTAEVRAQHVLFSVQSAEVIRVACENASTLGLGWLESGSLQLHTSLVEQLPATLRVYLGCATALAGSITSADLVKAHIDTGKVTLLTFDDFTGKPLPALRSRIKVRLRDQDLDIFNYGESFPPTILYWKSRYVNEEFPRYSEQVAFDEALEDVGLFDLGGYGPSEQEFHKRLNDARLEVFGFELRPATTLPNIDDRCGATFTYRQLIECGETWETLRPDNVPRNPQTFNALHSLAALVLDPVVEYFGGIKLTYGFASASLVRHIKGAIAPKLDQHAACEVNRNGQLISPRRGAAIDFLVEYEDMTEVARWISNNCPFDRMYIYGVDRPIHVSVGPDRAKEVFEMVSVGGRRLPRRIKL